MPLQFAVIWPIVCGVGKYILEIPLVHKGIENYFAGTKTIWDNLAWGVFEKYAGIVSPDARGAAIADGLVAVQSQYDEVKARVAAGEVHKDVLLDVVGPAALPWIEQIPVEP